MGVRADFSWQAAGAGMLASFVGFASSFPIIVNGLVQVGASPAQATSGLMALSLAMGLGGVYLSLKTRMPVSIAWSTPGAALLATTQMPQGGFATAVGAFVVTALLLAAAGIWRPLGRAISVIPHPIASAMLAGILFGLCLAPVRAVAEFPLIALPVVGIWAVTARFSRLLAVPAAVLATALLIVATSDFSAGQFADAWPRPVAVLPQFSLDAIVGIAFPLFIVAMASQNIPGAAVLAVNGYQAEAGALFRMTGLFSLFAAPFGGHGVNLAAITAAMCASPDAHDDPARRYWAALVSGIVYVLFGLMAGLATAFISASPSLLIEAVAGLALLGAFSTSMMGALAAPRARDAAVVTFLVTASGLSVLGIGSAFWGLIAGGAIHLARAGRDADKP